MTLFFLIDVKTKVKQALSHKLGTSNTLLITSSFPLCLHSWAHSSKLSCHPGLAQTLFCGGQRHLCKVQTSQHMSNKSSILRPLSILYRPWSSLWTLPQGYLSQRPHQHPNGHTSIIAVLYWFFKAAYLMPLSKLSSTKETTKLMVLNFFKLHGLPKVIVPDHGLQFTSQF